MLHETVTAADDEVPTIVHKIAEIPQREADTASKVEEKLAVILRVSGNQCTNNSRKGCMRFQNDLTGRSHVLRFPSWSKALLGIVVVNATLSVAVRPAQQGEREPLSSDDAARHSCRTEEDCRREHAA